jgi:ParB-like chromosome segregation protein Spo0J
LQELGDIAAQMAEAATVSVRIVILNDALALEAQLVENLIRANVHPMEEAQRFPTFTPSKPTGASR